jgi:hypothetical protein
VKTITSIAGLGAYGIEPLTGEACGLSYRILCDITEASRKILAKAFGIPGFSLAEPWNRGTADNPHVGSIMLAPEQFTFLGIFALLESGCTEVWLTRDGGLIGIEPADTAESIEANRQMAGERLVHSFVYRGTAGDRNVHVMSGRVV